MKATTAFERRFAKAFRATFEGPKRILPAYLEVGPQGFVKSESAKVAQLEQAREHEKRRAIALLQKAIAAMMRANLAHVRFNEIVGQEEFANLPFAPEE